MKKITLIPYSPKIYEEVYYNKFGLTHLTLRTNLSNIDYKFEIYDIESTYKFLPKTPRATFTNNTTTGYVVVDNIKSTVVIALGTQPEFYEVMIPGKYLGVLKIELILPPNSVRTAEDEVLIDYFDIEVMPI